MDVIIGGLRSTRTSRRAAETEGDVVVGVVPDEGSLLADPIRWCVPSARPAGSNLNESEASEPAACVASPSARPVAVSSNVTRSDNVGAPLADTEHVTGPATRAFGDGADQLMTGADADGLASSVRRWTVPTPALESRCGVRAGLHADREAHAHAPPASNTTSATNAAPPRDART